MFSLSDCLTVNMSQYYVHLEQPASFILFQLYIFLVLFVCVCVCLVVWLFACVFIVWKFMQMYISAHYFFLCASFFVFSPSQAT